jgi:glycosyltransferase involved in cell wall biosynthesis
MRVGVVVPVHGWAPYLAETLDGILGQDPAPDDVVVVDDGSPEPVLLHVDHAQRCRLVRRPERGGLPAARRTGVAALDATELVALCDDDDVWRPGKLRAQIAALRDRASRPPAACFARAVVIGPDGRETGERWPDPPTTLPDLYERNPVCVSGALLRRDAVEHAGGIARELPAAEDWDLWLRLLAAGEGLTFAPDAVVAYRRRQGAMSGDIATLARAQQAVHAEHAGLVDEATRRRTGAVDERALAAGLTRAGDHAGAREAYARAAALAPLPRRDRTRAAVLRVPLARSALGRRDPYRA